MESSNIKSLTNNQIMKYQRAIQDQLIIDMPIIKDLQKKLNRLKARTYQLQATYRELDIEIYLRTKDIIKVKPKTEKKKRARKSDSKKTIDRLVKQLGSEEVKRLIEKINQTKELNK